jgi:hypothetical protein
VATIAERLLIKAPAPINVSGAATEYRSRDNFNIGVNFFPL